MPLGSDAPQASSTKTASSYAVREVKGATQAEWDGWLEGSPGGGHVYHTHEWGEFKRRLGWYLVRLVL